MSSGVFILQKIDVEKNFKEMRLELLNELDKIGRLIKKDFESTVATWDVKPTFTFKKKLSGSRDTFFIAEIDVTTEDWLYAYLNSGSQSGDKRLLTPLPRKPKVKPYGFGTGLGTYSPSIHGFLAIPVSWSPKTRKGLIGSVHGGESGGVVYRATASINPIEGRQWDEAIFLKWDAEMKDRIDKALGAALSKYFG